jgi:hypothetical protein
MATFIERIKAGLQVFNRGYPKRYALETKQAPLDRKSVV